jgi:hypothetical protein
LIVKIEEIPENTIKSLSEYFGTRVQDTDCIYEIIPCIHTFILKFNLKEELLYIILSQMFSEVRVSALPQESRKLVCEILEYTVNKKPKGKFSPLKQSCWR